MSFGTEEPPQNDRRRTEAPSAATATVAVAEPAATPADVPGPGRSWQAVRGLLVRLHFFA